MMKDASSEQRNATAAAISAGSAQRDIGTSSRSAAGRIRPDTSAWSVTIRLFAPSSVLTLPGHTQLALIPCSTYSTATARVNCSTPPFEAS